MVKGWRKMTDDVVTTERSRGGMSEQRRRRVRLEISREAARLFWAQGVDGTSGDQIAEAVGLSTRTIWRHFRSKESCAEPIVAQSVEWELATLRSWPLHRSLEEHFATEAKRLVSEISPSEQADAGLGVKMIRLAETEPALRTAWLMACDQVERELAAVIATRLGVKPDGLQVRLHAAAAAAAVIAVVGSAPLSLLAPFACIASDCGPAVAAVAAESSALRLLLRILLLT